MWKKKISFMLELLVMYLLFMVVIIVVCRHDLLEFLFLCMSVHDVCMSTSVPWYA